LSPIIITQGDAAGAGWYAFKEIVAASGKYFPALKRDGKLRRLVLVGDIFENDADFIARYFHAVPYTAKPAELDALLSEKKIRKPLFLFLQKGKAVEPGKGNALVALRSWHAFQKAMKLFQAHPNSALVTLPVSKELIMKGGVEFTGHTEQLAQGFGRKVFMCMYHPKFSVIPLTNHIPLATVPRKLYELPADELLQALRQFNAIFKPRGKIAWCGLNPHCGENGRVGNEEEFIRRTIDALTAKSMPIDGPISADAVFTKHVLKAYSLVIANYHDQGLIPFKALNGMAGVNTTLGLPRLRVSPDHGTAFSRTAAKQVDATGVLASLRFALKFQTAWQQVSA
jgi:4-hydroxythreonine-4-phosphate dehydrogenase